MTEKSVTFGLVHGSFMGAWCWDFVRWQLEREGHDSVALDLPIADPDATLEDYTAETVRRLQGEQELVLVGHSRGVNVIVRAAGRLPVKQLVAVCPSFHEDTLAPFLTPGTAAIPRKNFEAYDDGLRKLPNGLWAIDKQTARDRLFNASTEAIQADTLARLRPQRRAEHEQVVDSWPIVPMAYVISLGDMAITRTYSEYVANELLKTTPMYMPGDHTPQLSVPYELTSLLMRLQEPKAT